MTRRDHQCNRYGVDDRSLFDLGYIPQASIGPEGVPKGLFPPPDLPPVQLAKDSLVAEASAPEVQ